MARFEALRNSGFAVTYSQTYLEQGRYAEAVASTGAEAGLVDTRTPDARFTDVTVDVLPTGGSPDAGSAGGGVTLADLDRDGDLDILAHGDAGTRVFDNSSGAFRDVSSRLPPGVAAQPTVGSVAGDYNNDGVVDLVVLTRGAPLSLVGAADRILRRRDGRGRTRRPWRRVADGGVARRGPRRRFGSRAGSNGGHRPHARVATEQRQRPFPPGDDRGRSVSGAWRVCAPANRLRQPARRRFAGGGLGRRTAAVPKPA